MYFIYILAHFTIFPLGDFLLYIYLRRFERLQYLISLQNFSQVRFFQNILLPNCLFPPPPPLTTLPFPFFILVPLWFPLRPSPHTLPHLPPPSFLQLVPNRLPHLFCLALCFTLLPKRLYFLYHPRPYYSLNEAREKVREDMRVIYTVNYCTYKDLDDFRNGLLYGWWPLLGWFDGFQHGFCLTRVEDLFGLIFYVNSTSIVALWIFFIYCSIYSVGSWRRWHFWNYDVFLYYIMTK